MLNERLREFLGEDFKLLDKPAVYLTKEERFRIFQALLLMFGAESTGNKIIIFKEESEKEAIDEIKSAIEMILEITLDIEYNSQKKYWELEIDEEGFK